MEPIFSDKEVRKVLFVHNLDAQDRDGASDTRDYLLGKAIRDAVVMLRLWHLQKKLLGVVVKI